MIEQDGEFIQSRQRFYEQHYRVAEPIDHWHAYAQQVVHSTARGWFTAYSDQRALRTLNAGSGGSDYGISSSMVHLDLIGDRVSHLPDYMVAHQHLTLTAFAYVNIDGCSSD